MLTLLFIACAHVQTSASGVPLDPSTLCLTPPGFWSGLWHGLISPFAMIASWLKGDIIIYAPCNSGGWYDFGFITGASSALGGGAASSRKR